MVLPVASIGALQVLSEGKLRAVLLMILCADQRAAKASWRSLSAQRVLPCLVFGPSC